MTKGALHEVHDTVADLLEKATGNAITIKEVVAARLHMGLGEEHTVRERGTNGLPLVDKPGDMVANL